MDQPRPALVTVVIVSFNTRELLVRCLHSLVGDVEAGRAEVYVVDNRSEDGSASAARELASWAIVIEAERNLGFGSAVNLAASRSDSEWVLAANADIAFTPGALQRLIDGGADPRVGAVAPRLLLPDGRTQHSVHPLPTVPVSLLFNLGLAHVIPGLGDRLCLEGFWDPDRARPVPWAIGACLLLRRTAYAAAGRFDPAQWMYAEDLDLGWRLRDNGWVTRYEPRSRVRHEGGAATRRTFGAQEQTRFMAATYELLQRRRGRLRMWTIAAINIGGAAGRALWMVPLGWVLPRWRGPSARNLGWLQAHVQGARRPRRFSTEV
jgi:N-acetylglucosaminyl-diphospho-decaprenol L-rhamnosyltransferase